MRYRGDDFVWVGAARPGIAANDAFTVVAGILSERCDGMMWEWCLGSGLHGSSRTD